MARDGRPQKRRAGRRLAQTLMWVVAGEGEGDMARQGRAARKARHHLPVPT
jgi:hypothetical protein